MLQASQYSLQADSMSSFAKLLLVEDDFDLADNVVAFLESRGFAVIHAPNGALALNELLEDAFDLILLDINLPGIDGLSLCERLRNEMKDSTPVLMLTAADTVEDRLKGFAAGTDDYVIKPFALPEIEARILALLRRASDWSASASKEISFGDLTLDTGQMKAHIADRELKLTVMGFRILQQLVEKAPNIVRRNDLELALWKGEPPGSDALRTHIFALRQALGKAGDKDRLATIRGVGYKLIRN